MQIEEQDAPVNWSELLARPGYPQHLPAFIRSLGNQPLTHLWVNPVIKAVLRRNWSGGSPDSQSLLKALDEYWSTGDKGPALWANQAVSPVSVLELGFDLGARPWFATANQNVLYTGWRCRPGPTEASVVTAPERHSNSAIPKLLDIDWRQLSELKTHWQGASPPEWILAVDTLDHLRNPAPLLQAIANLYEVSARTEKYDKERMPPGHMLVATRNPFFFGKNFELEGEQLYLRSRCEMRRRFRDAGLEVVDEASPPLPRLGLLRERFDTKFTRALQRAVPPLHFWIVRMARVERVPVTGEEIAAWRQELLDAHPTVEDGTASSPRANPHASVLAILDSISEDLSGVHWRYVAPGQRLIAARNTGGQLYVVREGRLCGYLTETNAIVDGSSAVRLTRDANEIAGEMEVFDQDVSGADRLFILSLYGTSASMAGSVTGAVKKVGRPPKAGASKPSVLWSKVMVVPARCVQKMVNRAELFGNAFLKDLRSKTLEAEIGLTHEESRNANLRLRWNFVGRWAARPVDVTDIRRIACALENAVERDRLWGLPDRPEGRFLFFVDFHGARQSLARNPKSNPNRRANSALQFLEACGVIRLLVFDTQFFSEESKREEEMVEGLREPHAERPVDRRKMVDYVARVNAKVSLAAQKVGLDECLKRKYPRVQDGAQKLLNAYTKKQNYTIIIVKSDFQLRRMTTGLTNEILEGFEFLRSKAERATHEDLFEQDYELAEEAVSVLKARAEFGLAHVDSMGVKVFE